MLGGMTASLVMFLSLATAASTMAGGLLAMALRERLPLVLGFSAGAVIGVAFFDLLPEAMTAGDGIYDARALLGFAALGFFAYALLDRLAAQHGTAGVPSPARGACPSAREWRGRSGLPPGALRSPTRACPRGDRWRARRVRTA